VSLLFIFLSLDPFTCSLVFSVEKEGDWEEARGAMTEVSPRQQRRPPAGGRRGREEEVEVEEVDKVERDDDKERGNLRVAAVTAAAPAAAPAALAVVAAGRCGLDAALSPLEPIICIVTRDNQS
jgi:hypothetical protein